MASMFDMYLKNDIMLICEESFNRYLKEEGVIDEGLTDEERDFVGTQVDYLLDMIQDIYTSYDDDSDAYVEIADKLIGISIVAKMNEARLCRLLNEAADKLKDD